MILYKVFGTDKFEGTGEVHRKENSAWDSMCKELDMAGCELGKKKVFNYL